MKTKNIFPILLSILLLHLLSGCETTPAIKTSSGSNTASSTSGIRKIEHFKHYPSEVKGFHRGQTIAYDKGQTNISTGYNILTTDKKIIATIYEYPKENRSISLKNQFQIEKTNIKNFHKTTKILSNETLTFTKNSKSYSAYRAKMKYGANFLGRVQRLYSELILIDINNGRLVKLRSTTPITQKAYATKKNMELMEAINWAH